MSREEYDGWRQANAVAALGNYRAKRPCADCPTWFRDAALARRACNGAQRARLPTGKHSARRLLQWREAQQRKRSGVRLRRSPDELAVLRADVLARHSTGTSYAQIGRDLGISWSYARNIVLDAAA